MSSVGADIRICRGRCAGREAIEVTAALAPPRPASLGRAEFTRARVEVALNDDRDADRLINGFYLAALYPIERGHLFEILVLYALAAPPSLWLLLVAAHTTRRLGSGAHSGRHGAGGVHVLQRGQPDFALYQPGPAPTSTSSATRARPESSVRTAATS
jgi:hypothetical protein